MGESLITVLNKFYDSYGSSTPKRLKIVDSYLLMILLTGIVQFVYCCLVGTFPFNSFLAGFISCVASFVLGGGFERKLGFRLGGRVSLFGWWSVESSCFRSIQSMPQIVTTEHCFYMNIVSTCWWTQYSSCTLHSVLGVMLSSVLTMILSSSLCFW